MQYTKGFSLIELMVVIAIVAILAAVAVPAYSTYRSKVVVNKVVRMAFESLQNAQTKYQQTGVFPTSVTLGPNTVTNAWSGTGAYQNFSFVSYFVSSDGKGAMFGVSVNGLSGMGASYVDGGEPTDNTGQRTVYMAVRDGGSTVKYACGSYVASYAYPAQGLSPSVLPSTCTCLEVNGFAEGTASC